MMMNPFVVKSLFPWRLWFSSSLLILLLFSACESLSSIPAIGTKNHPSSTNSDFTKFVILGGTGKIGTAVAAHLMKRRRQQQQEESKPFEIVLVGRRRSSSNAAIEDVKQQIANVGYDGSHQPKLSFQFIDNIWDGEALKASGLFEDATVVIHTAGPYAEEHPTVLDAVISSNVPVYVDVSDPLPFLDASLERFDAAVQSKTTALVAAGAFPGMSNVLAMECAAAAGKDSIIQDVRFNYFTKGLGGSGMINLYITNIGFGEPMTQYDKGRERAFTNLSGKLLGSVDFFLNDSSNNNKNGRDDNNAAKQRVGTIQQVFAWPFPEATTVGRELNIEGSSSAAMGTAPALWNGMLGLLVNIVPRHLWRSKRFSQFMADFSQPLVLLTDFLLKQFSSDNVGETHAMRIDVTATASGSTNNKIEKLVNDHQQKMISIVQAHESFRQCVGQSCAEFALDLVEHPHPHGVYLPEQRYRLTNDRTRIISKLTSTPGTFAYTGPVVVTAHDDNDSSTGSSKVPMKAYPSKIHQVVAQAKKENELDYKN